MGRKKRTSRKTTLIFFLGGISLGSGFGIYLWILYAQLTASFNQEEQLIPTRIYSDVARIALNQPRSYVEERLNNLVYTFESSATAIHFTPHSIDYPTYLVPENHPAIPFLRQSEHLPIVSLQFDRPGPSGALKTIELENQPLPDLYLEPELVATLSQTGDAKHEIRAPLSFENIPSSVWKAIIAIEDQHFLEHNGLDPRGLARALWVNLKTHSLAQGGSTITQQLVKNLMARRSKNLFRKFNEIFLSFLLEARFTKEQILERYLNEVYLGQVGNLEVHGVAQGAEHFFGKKVSDLNLGETALMAGLIRGPGFYSPYRYRGRAVERQRLVLKKMVETGQIAEEEARLALHQPIRLAPPQSSATKAPFFTDYVKAELSRKLKDRIPEADIPQAGLRVYTTLDPLLNTVAQTAVSQGIAHLEARMKINPNDRLEGALATVDQSTGYVRALIGGRNYAKSNFNRILNMKRQVGSTFKPIVYLSAFQKGENSRGITYGPGYPIEDSPWTLSYDHGKQSWSPKNYEKLHTGWIPLRLALTHSVNTAAARFGYEVGIDNVIKTARSLGITSDLPNVPSLSLGVAELSPLELLSVYSTLANRGTQMELSVIRGIVKSDGQSDATELARYGSHPNPVIDSSSVDLLTDILQGVFTEGTARGALKMGFNRPAAGKTGTTSQYRDAWFAGFTPELTTVVWVGMDQTFVKESSTPKNKNQNRASLTGANSALPIWVNFMGKALSISLPLNFPQSPDLVEVRIDRHTGKAATSSCPAEQVIVEKYRRGREPREQSCDPQWPTGVPKTEG